MRRREDLSTPRRGVRVGIHYDSEAFGRFSEAIARFIGTGRFLVLQTIVVVLWVVWNVLFRKPVGFDRYPFIFLTLALSLQAAYAAPLILLAQNRQADRDRVNLEEDRAQNVRAIADTEYLTREIADLRIAVGDLASRDFLRSELQRLAEEVAGRSGGEPDPVRRADDGAA